MRIRIGASLIVIFIACGCASMRDTLGGMEPGTSRTLDEPFDSTWAAVVEVIQPYPVAETNKADGVLVTDWVERLLDPAEFVRRGVPKQRMRFEIAIASREEGSRITVRQTVELLVPVFVDPVSPGRKVLCQYPWPADVVGASPASALYYTDVCAIENPSEKPLSSLVYVWQHISQVKGAPAPPSSEREQEILDATETALKRTSERHEASRTPPTDSVN